MCAPAITGVTVLARYSLQEILMGTYLGSDGRRTKQIKKKSLQENALQRISTEVFVYLLLQIVLLCTLFIYLFIFGPHWCGMSYQVLCWKTKLTTNISRYKQITKASSYQ